MSQNQYTDPKIWGPHFWFMMRCIAYNYPDKPDQDNKNTAYYYYDNIKHLLPCKRCQIHYKQMLLKHPLKNSLCCKSCMIKWVNTIYDEVMSQFPN
jgi:hypothetical protein